jgi:hypothetical protein
MMNIMANCLFIILYLLTDDQLPHIHDLLNLLPVLMMLGQSNTQNISSLLHDNNN